MSDRLARRIANELRRHPNFTPYEGSAKWPIHLRGEMVVTGNSEAVTIQVEIHIPHTYPRQHPKAFEVGGLIPRTGSDRWHLFDDDSLCLGSRHEVRQRFFRNPTLQGFLDALVIPYLTGFLQRNASGVPPQGELSHGDPGLWDDFRERIHVPDEQASLRLLEHMAGKPTISPNEMCPCGRQIKFKRCHQWRLETMRNFQSKAEFSRLASAIRCHIASHHRDSMNTQ